MMKFIKSMFVAMSVATALMFGSITASNAADPIVHIPTYNSQAAETPFHGLHFGSGFAIEHNSVFPTVSLGYTVVDGNLLFGIEALATVSEVPVIALDGKLGFVVTENIAAYGLVGVEHHTATKLNRQSVGVGVDVALAENVVLSGSYRKAFEDFDIQNGADQLRFGLKFKF